MMITVFERLFRLPILYNNARMTSKNGVFSANLKDNKVFFRLKIYV